MEKSQRREFLKKSILGLSGAALIPGSINGSVLCTQGQQSIPGLPSRVLGRTGIRTPLISLGTGSVNNPGLVRSAYFGGIKLFFSATYYGEGSNEKMVGDGLKGLPRDSYIIGTAIPLEGYDTRKGVLTSPMDINAYIKKAESSLTRFGLDYVDFILFPYAGKKEMIQNESLIKALQKLKQQGKTRFLGIATHGYCEEALRAAADAKVYDIAMTSYNYKTENKESMNESLAYAVKSGMGVVAMKTTAGAFNDKSAKQPVNTDAAFKWVLQNENISSIVSGISSLEELEKNLKMLENIKMSEQEIKDLNLTSVNSTPGLYCFQCRQCVPQCPYNLEIPTVMRSYMYAYGYRNLKYAKHTLRESGLAVDSCKNCQSCVVECRAGFDIKESIEDISRLNDVPEEFLVS
jgi:predicted aldo/keto reductase-like oxidoreductase